MVPSEKERAVTASSTLTLRRREEVAERTMAFYFDKPPGFQFKAGQSIDLTLIDPPQSDAEGNIRTFSIASAPKDPELTIATRMRDTAFKRVLASMPIGSPVQFEGPMGSFTLHHNAAKPAVFLTGGIGITPFLSIIRDAAAERLPHSLHLFYSNNRPEDAAFLGELQRLANANPAFDFVPTMTNMAASARPWRGLTRLIDREMVTAQLTNLQGPIYYIAGPPAMVAAMRAMLAAAGVDEDDIRTEEFAGY
jgi:ferredoxin-NADP reductase